MGRLFRGNLGFSFFYDQSATTVIANHIPPTLFLVVYAAVLAAVISLPIGLHRRAAPRRRRRPGARGCSSRVSFAMPAFWLGIILLIFSVHLTVFPLSGFGRGFFGHLYSLFLPAVTIALGFSTVLVRSLRASTIADPAVGVHRHRPDEGRALAAGCCGGTCSATPSWPSSRCTASTWPT